MRFLPNVNSKIVINNKEYGFTNLNGIVYMEPGKAAHVYKLMGQNKDLYALKVFFEPFRNGDLTANNKYEKLQNMPGFKIATREYLNVSTAPSSITQYPDLNNALLMPWIKGKNWYNYIAMGEKLTRSESLTLAHHFISNINQLFTHGYAHCDLSGKNVLLEDGSFSNVEFLDIEEVYGKGVSLSGEYGPAGSPGYVPNWVFETGLWGPYGDYFSASFLLTEMLCWSDPQIIDSRFGDSLFAPDEIGFESSNRKELVKPFLSTISSKIEKLFTRAWTSQSFEGAPTPTDWFREIDKLLKKNDGDDKEPNIGFPPKLSLSLDSIHFKINSTGNSEAVNITLANTGGGEISVDVDSESWLLVNPNQFRLQSHQSQNIEIHLERSFAAKIREKTFIFMKGLVIKTNAGNRILGGKIERV